MGNIGKSPIPSLSESPHVMVPSPLNVNSELHETLQAAPKGIFVVQLVTPSVIVGFAQVIAE